MQRSRAHHVREILGHLDALIDDMHPVEELGLQAPYSKARLRDFRGQLANMLKEKWCTEETTQFSAAQDAQTLRKINGPFACATPGCPNANKGAGFKLCNTCSGDPPFPVEKAKCPTCRCWLKEGQECLCCKYSTLEIPEDD